MEVGVPNTAVEQLVDRNARLAISTGADILARRPG